MYCKYCGKIIEDDSIFCKHCGKKIDNSVDTLSGSSRPGIVSRYTMLPQKVQIIIIIYGVWLLGWICVLIGNAKDRHFAEDFLMPFFLCTILIPFVLLSGLHIYRMKNKGGIQQKLVINNGSNSIDSQINGISPKPIVQNVSDATEPVAAEAAVLPQTVGQKVYISSELLLTFARQKGKMQIVNKSLDNSGSQEHYCMFTDSAGNTTRVDFNSQTRSLSAKDISEKKYQLCVNQLENGNYELAYINDKEIEDALPF